MSGRIRKSGTIGISIGQSPPGTVVSLRDRAAYKQVGIPIVSMSAALGQPVKARIRIATTEALTAPAMGGNLVPLRLKLNQARNATVRPAVGRKSRKDPKT